MKLKNYKIKFIESRNYGVSFGETKEINYLSCSKQDARKRFNAVFGLWCNIIDIELI